MRCFVVLGLAFLMLACSSSVKNYDDATALTKVKPVVAVKSVWIKDVGHLSQRQHAQLPPVVVGEVLYYANTDGQVGALGVEHGDNHWRVSLDEVITGGPGAGQGLVVVGTREAEILALEQGSGVLRWRTRVSGEMLAAPTLHEGLVIIQTIDGKVLALDAANGKQIWSYSHSIPALTLRGSSTPLVMGEQVFAGFADGKLVSLERKTGKLQWATTIATPKGRTDLERLVDIDGVFAVAADTLYVTTYQGNIAALATVSGETLWSREFSSFTGVILGDKQIFLSDAEGRVWALDTRSGGTLWRQDKLLGREPTLPVVMDGMLAVGDFDGYVHWLSVSDGQILARQSLEYLWRKANLMLPEVSHSRLKWRSVTTSPLAAGKRLYVRDNLGVLAAFELGARINAQ